MHSVAAQLKPQGSDSRQHRGSGSGGRREQGGGREVGERESKGEIAAAKDQMLKPRASGAHKNSSCSVPHTPSSAILNG